MISGEGTCRVHPLASSSSGSAPPPLFPRRCQLLRVKTTTNGLNETCVGLASGKPPGDPVSPQCRISLGGGGVREEAPGRAFVSPARAVARAAGRGRATSPFPATHRLARGGSRHHTLRPVCARCGSDKLLRSTALPTHQQRPLLPLPPRFLSLQGHAARQPAPPPRQL